MHYFEMMTEGSAIVEWFLVPVELLSLADKSILVDFLDLVLPNSLLHVK